MHPEAKIIEDTEQSDDSIVKLTGRLEQVFESSRLKQKQINGANHGQPH